MLKKIIIGFIAGIISGLFSTGGGMILVPAFIHFFKLNEKEARATSIMCVLAIECAIGGIIGGFIGSKLLNKLNEKFLKIIYIIFIIYIGIKFVKG